MNSIYSLQDAEHDFSLRGASGIEGWEVGSVDEKRKERVSSSHNCRKHCQVRPAGPQHHNWEEHPKGLWPKSGWAVDAELSAGEQ